MSELSVFLKVNREEKANVKHVASNAFRDANGNPVEWEFRALTTNEHDKIRDHCMYEKKGKKGAVQQNFNMSKYIAQMMTTCTVYPNLNDVELQNSYGVMSAEELIKEMIASPGEYSSLSVFLQKYNGFDETEADLIESAKN